MPPKYPYKSNVQSRGAQRDLIEQINLPLRGRPVTIGDRTRDIFNRCDVYRENYEENMDQMKKNINLDLSTSYQYNSTRIDKSTSGYGVKRRGMTADSSLGVNRGSIFGGFNVSVKRSKPVETKIFSFKADKSRKIDKLIKTSDYMGTKSLTAKNKSVQNAEMK